MILIQNVIQTEPLKSDDVNVRTLEIADETISRLKYNHQSKLTNQSRHVIASIIKYFNNWRINPQQIGYFMTDVANCNYQNVAVSILLTKLSYLRCQRYIFRLIKQYHYGISYQYSDIVNMIIYAVPFAVQKFTEHVKDVHSRKDFNNLIYCHVKDIEDFSEMLELNKMMDFWKNHHASHGHRDIIVGYF